MQCPRCGSEVQGEANYCDDCGAPLRDRPVLSPAGGLAGQARILRSGAGAGPSPRPGPPVRPGSQGGPREVISHWSMMLEGVRASPMAFYASVREAVERRELPETGVELVEWPEGGLFTPKRLYLRVSRRDHVFDICGAPFGKGFFVSWWLGEFRKPGLVFLLAVLSLFLMTVWGAGFASYATGRLWVFPLVFGFLVFLMARFLGREAFQAADEFLRVLPYVGLFYAALFHPYTYYRIDTALMFEASVKAAFEEVVDRLREAHGLRALSRLEYKPVRRDFFRGGGLL